MIGGPMMRLSSILIWIKKWTGPQGNRTLFAAKARKYLEQDAFIPAGAQALAA